MKAYSNSVPIGRNVRQQTHVTIEVESNPSALRQRSNVHSSCLRAYVLV
jgi:hypothetical protein